jgi:hypothetical protein
MFLKMKVVFCVFYYLLIVSNVFVAEEEGKKKVLSNKALTYQSLKNFNFNFNLKLNKLFSSP